MIYRLLIFFVLAVFPFISSAQERVEVKDPEIKFSYVLPQGWEVKDDGYDYKVISRSMENTVISMTYLESAQGSGEFNSIGTKQSFEQDFLFEIQDILPEEFSNLKVRETGSLTIDGTSARWVKFQHGNKGEQIGIFYMYQKLNQSFKITVSSPASQFEKAKPVFTSVVNSFHAEKR